MVFHRRRRMASCPGWVMATTRFLVVACYAVRNSRVRPPFTLRDEALHPTAVGRGCRRGLASMSALIAQPARCHHIVRSVLAAFLAGDQMLRGATKGQGGPRPETQLRGTIEPHGLVAVETATRLPVEGLVAQGTKCGHSGSGKGSPVALKKDDRGPGAKGYAGTATGA